MGWTEYGSSQQAFIVDHRLIVIDTGRQIDWPNVPASYDYGSVAGHGRLPAGLAMKLSGAGPKIIPVVDTATDVPVGLLANVCNEQAEAAGGTGSHAGIGIIRGGPVYENLLPLTVAGALPAALKTKLQAVGIGFDFQTYTDSSAT